MQNYRDSKRINNFSISLISKTFLLAMTFCFYVFRHFYWLRVLHFIYLMTKIPREENFGTVNNKNGITNSSEIFF